jgi:hypothetical protein
VGEALYNLTGSLRIANTIGVLRDNKFSDRCLPWCLASCPYRKPKTADCDRESAVRLS